MKWYVVAWLKSEIAAGRIIADVKRLARSVSQGSILQSVAGVGPALGSTRRLLWRQRQHP